MFEIKLRYLSRHVRGEMRRQITALGTASFFFGLHSDTNTASLLPITLVHARNDLRIVASVAATDMSLKHTFPPIWPTHGLPAACWGLAQVPQYLSQNT